MSDKHLVCKGATVYCSKSMVNNSPGTAIPLTITSNTLVELNGGKVAATDKDCTPANMCFGNCNTGTNPPPPCVANVQWSKFYEGAEVTEAGMKLLTEESEATCMAFGGKVKIAFHGQVANPQPEEQDEVSPEVMAGILPVNPKPEETVVITEGDEEREKKITDAYWIDENTQEKMQEIYPGKKVILCLKTSGYVEGEQADIKIKMEDGKEKTASGEVKWDGTVVIENFGID
jgi:hypothetical protein